MTTPGNNITTNEQAPSSDGMVSSEIARGIQDAPVNNTNQQPASFPRADVSAGYQQHSDQQLNSLASFQSAITEVHACSNMRWVIDTIQEAPEDYFEEDNDEGEDEDEDSLNNNDAAVESEVHDGNEVQPVVPIQTNRPYSLTSLPLAQEWATDPNLSESYAVFEELSSRYERFMQGLEDHGIPIKRRKCLIEEVISDALTKNVYQPPSPETEPLCCSICLEDFQAGELQGILNCSHSYHDKCIQEWLLKDNSCPLCRTKGVTI